MYTQTIQGTSQNKHHIEQHKKIHRATQKIRRATKKLGRVVLTVMDLSKHVVFIG
jgi:hypothetical protein